MFITGLLHLNVGLKAGLTDPSASKLHTAVGCVSFLCSAALISTAFINGPANNYLNVAVAATALALTPFNLKLLTFPYATKNNALISKTIAGADLVNLMALVIIVLA